MYYVKGSTGTPSTSGSSTTMTRHHSKSSTSLPMRAPPTTPPMTMSTRSSTLKRPSRPASGSRSGMSHASMSSIASHVKRRSSSRSIKRKKFDDELVESSLIKTNFPKGKVLPPMIPPPPPEKEKPKPEPTPSPSEKRRSSSKSSSSSKRKKQRQSQPATKDHGRWKPQDDLALISAVQQTNDLEAVYQGVKFSCRFTLREVEERWYALLYDPVVSRISQQAMRTMHPDIKISVLSKALFSEDEEKILGTIASASQPSLDTFQGVINKNATIFHQARTAKVLQTHWLLMKQYHLLPDQSVQPMPRGDHVLNFSDAEDMMEDSQLQDPKDEILEQELAQFDRRQKREIRHLENEIPKWQVMVDSVTGISPPDFDNQTLAVLRGRLVRYLMRSREITIGRATKDNTIDVDLSLEGPAWKVSRKQGVIKLRNSGEFYVANEGKRAIHIDGKAVLKGQKTKLNNNSVVEIAGLRFIFLINQDLINVIRAEAAKMGV
ncbi:microspherule protein 1-like isoform X3 [Amphiura filiformis]|uniref:microspherule protein 1-like isoform X3 n=1 Tax=Amphiura filiformis TaxID=82378 RepID=UPI003B220CD5